MPASPTAAQLRGIEKAAKAASRKAYAPYSRFRVGAAVLTASGRIFAGCNVENASYGLCLCAERNAIHTAVAAGERKLLAVAVFTSTPAPTAPCGACRQVIGEFGPKAKIVSVCASRQRIEATLEELLPERFGPENLR